MGEKKIHLCLCERVEGKGNSNPCLKEGPTDLDAGKD